jgi:hypothetical protein
MRAYLIMTGAVFGLLVAAHIWRVIEEGPRLAKDPWFVLFTVVAAGMGLWAWRLLRSTPPSR